MQNSKDDMASNFGYTGKSKLIYQRKSAGSQRSKTSSKYGGLQRFNEANEYPDENGEKRSILSKAGLRRFNEELAPNMAPSSKKSGLGVSNLKSLQASKKTASKAPSQIVSQKSKAPSQVALIK